MTNTFTVVNDDTLCAAIASTRGTLVYVAPGITKRVVDALEGALTSNPTLQITLIVDIDPEVYRLGFGTEEGLKALQELVQAQHLPLRQQEGVRLAADRYRMLFTKIDSLCRKDGKKAVALTSSIKGEGKTTTTAMIAAQDAKSTLFRATSSRNRFHGPACSALVAKPC